jgi:hypothetical protein
MAEYTGKDLHLEWITLAGTVPGTVDLSTSQYRTLGENTEIGLVDASAGADTNRTYLTTLKDGTFEYSALHQTNGTALKAVLAPGTYGTLVIKPEGTASGKPTESVPCVVSSRNMNYPYDGVVEITATFQRNGG